MHDIITRAIRIPAALAATGALLFSPAIASAQDIPSYAQPTVVSTDETIHGRIASVDGAFTLSVDDDRGFVDSVTLHQGTIINPTGLSLAPGMIVTIAGYNAGSVFDANEIDTPYSYSGPLPTPVYYGPGYWCPGFDYGYGPSFSLAIIFGGGYHFEHQPFGGRAWDGHGYFGSSIGREHGHAFAPGRNVGYDNAESNRRYPTDGARLGDSHAPAGFAGRSFAGQGYTPEHRTVPETRGGYQGAPRSYGQNTAFGAQGLRAGAPSAPSYRATEPRGGESRGGARAESHGGGHAESHGGGGSRH